MTRSWESLFSIFLTVMKQQRGLTVETEQENNLLSFTQVAEIRFIVNIALLTMWI